MTLKMTESFRPEADTLVLGLGWKAISSSSNCFHLDNLRPLKATPSDTSRLPSDDGPTRSLVSLTQPPSQCRYSDWTYPNRQPHNFLGTLSTTLISTLDPQPVFFSDVMSLPVSFSGKADSVPHNLPGYFRSPCPSLVRRNVIRSGAEALPFRTSWRPCATTVLNLLGAVCQVQLIPSPGRASHRDRQPRSAFAYPSCQ